MPRIDLRAKKFEIKDDRGDSIQINASIGGDWETYAFTDPVGILPWVISAPVYDPATAKTKVEMSLTSSQSQAADAVTNWGLLATDAPHATTMAKRTSTLKLEE